MANYQYVFGMRNLSKTWPGGKEVLKNINLQFLPGAKIGVLGYNGAGKSTLLKIMAGEINEYNGEVWAADGVKIGYLAQEPHLDENLDVGQNVMEGLADLKALLTRFEEVSLKFGEVSDDAQMDALINEQAELQEKIDAADAWDLDSRAEVAMDALRCPPSDAKVDVLSGGEKRRVALCRLLLSRPDMLLLDEPTNHLDAESIAWLQHFLGDYPGTVVMITHDRYFLDHVTGWILELDRGQGIPYEGNYSSWLEQKQKRLQQEGREQEARMRSIAMEREWINASARARQSKSKARISAFNNLVRQAESADSANDTAQIVIPPGPRLGDMVINAEHLTKSYGDKLLMEDLNFRLPAGGIVGIIGANGAGKTTAMKMLTGLLRPSSGEAMVSGFDVYTESEKIKENIGYMSQKFSLYEDLTVMENITFYGGIYGLNLKEIKERGEASLERLNMSDFANSRVQSLPLGWKQKLAFSVATLHKRSIVFLDEPTGGVDPVTRRQFWEMIYTQANKGTTIFVTTHYMDEAEYCDRVSIMVEGKIEALDSPKKLKEQFKVDSMNEVFLKLARNIE